MSSDRVHERVPDDQAQRLVAAVLDKAQEFIAGLTPEQVDDLIEGRAHVGLTEVEHTSDVIEREPTRYPTARVRAELSESSGTLIPEMHRSAMVTIYSTVTQPADYPSPRTEDERPRARFSSDIATAREVVRVLNGGQPWPEGAPYEGALGDDDDDTDDLTD